MCWKPSNEAGATQTAGEAEGKIRQEKVENSDIDLRLGRVCHSRGK